MGNKISYTQLGYTSGAIGTWPAKENDKYLPTANLPDAYQKTTKGFIINSDPPWKRLSDGSDRAPDAVPNIPNRFNEEVVNIDLRGKAIYSRSTKHGRNHR